MGFFDGVQRWQRRRKALGLLEQGAIEAALRVIGDDEALRRELAEKYLDAGKLELSQALLGHEGGSTLDALLSMKPVDPELDRLKAVALGKQLLDDDRALEIARALEQRGEAALALNLLERNASAGRSWKVIRAALERLVAQAQWTHAWPLVEAGFALKRELEHTAEWTWFLSTHARVVTALRGAEQVRVDLLMRGEEDPFVEDGYLVLADALRKEGPPLTTRLSLVSAPQELREADARLEGDKKSATGLLRLGSAKLRLGELADARDAFERGRAVAPRHFGLVAGLGAAITYQRTNALERVRALPDLAPLPGLEALVPDVEALTNLELRVVQAAVRPLAGWLPRLQGATLQLLPLDSRVSDLPAGTSCVRVETLFDLHSFAREFARLVHRVLPPELRARADEETFANAYPRWLAESARPELFDRITRT